MPPKEQGWNQPFFYLEKKTFFRQQSNTSGAEANRTLQPKQATSLSFLSLLRRVECVGLGSMV